MDFWQIIYGIDWVLFGIVGYTVFYLAFYAVAGMFSSHPAVPRANRHNSFIVLIPAYKRDKVVAETVMSVLSQTYPQRFFDVIVISDEQSEMTNFRLAQMPITLLTPNFTTYTKARALQYAVSNLPQFKIYDLVVILDAGTIVDQNFLQEMNDAYEVAGTKAIQAHRLSKSRETEIAHMDAVFEEINNTIFRRGHIAIGLPAALTSSGNAFSYRWFRENIFKVNTPYCEKELEALLLHQHVFIDYFDDILVYDEKSRTVGEFNDRHARWFSAQFHVAVKNLRYLPTAVLNRYYGWIDKLLQWLLMPRTIMVSLITFMSLFMPFIYLTLAIKWWLLFAFVMFIFALATPDYLVDKKWNKSFAKAPFIMLGSLFSPAKAVQTEAEKLTYAKPKKKQ